MRPVALPRTDGKQSRLVPAVWATAALAAAVLTLGTWIGTEVNFLRNWDEDFVSGTSGFTARFDDLASLRTAARAAVRLGDAPGRWLFVSDASRPGSLAAVSRGGVSIGVDVRTGMQSANVGFGTRAFLDGTGVPVFSMGMRVRGDCGMILRHLAIDPVLGGAFSARVDPRDERVPRPVEWTRIGRIAASVDGIAPSYDVEGIEDVCDAFDRKETSGTRPEGPDEIWIRPATDPV